jgi:tRNA nucleotidyltransferase (CCA-adding enzyme)
MCLLPTITRKDLAEVSLEIAREATKGARQVERFAEHPYLEAFVSDFRVNIVPCYCAKNGEWISATDRTPFHTDYVRKRLDEPLRDEVRLLKKFMQGIEVYGAEIKTGGFSGYLCELLILHSKSFAATLGAFANCTSRMTIDIENFYEGKERELKLAFPEPLVVIDPVDKRRNVASAVQSHKVDTFAGAARAFLKAPNLQFFKGYKTKKLSVKALEKNIEHHGSALVLVTFSAVEAVPDVLWGQYYRTQRALRKLLEINDFRVLRDAVWTDEKTLGAFVLEFEQRVIPNVKQHIGPPLERKIECEDFLTKYVDNDEVVSGPYIENGRWVVQLPRKHVDAIELLRAKLKDGGKNAGIADLVSRAFSKGVGIATNAEIVKLCKSNENFSEFLTRFLDGKPFWLEPAQA